MRLSQKIQILKDIIIVITCLAIFASLVSYKVGKVNGYQQAYVEIVD